MRGQTNFEIALFASLGAGLVLLIRSEAAFLAMLPAYLIASKLLDKFKLR